VTTRTAKPRLIAARFKGKCRTCGCVVEPGTPVYFAKHFGVRCQSCGPHTVDDQPLPSRRANKRFGRPDRADRRHTEPTPPGGTLPGDESAAKRAQCDLDGVHRYQFSSVGEMVLDALDDYAQNDTNRERIREMQSQALSGSDAWGNYFTRDRLLNQLHDPDVNLLEAIESLRQELVGEVLPPTTPRRRIRRGLDYGDELDSDRYLQREPNAWERSVREPQPRRTVTIGCNVCVHCRQKPEELLYRGAATLALADALTTRGLNVEIVLFKAVSDPTPQVGLGVIKCQLKDPMMPLSLGDLAFSLCEIAFTRNVVICGAARHWTGALRTGWGTPSALPASDRQGIDYLIDLDVKSRDAAADWLRTQINREVNHVNA
jgi:hypothetical protein